MELEIIGEMRLAFRLIFSAYQLIEAISKVKFVASFDTTRIPTVF